MSNGTGRETDVLSQEGMPATGLLPDGMVFMKLRLPKVFRGFLDLVKFTGCFLEERYCIRQPPEKIHRIQEKRFLSIVRYAYENVPMYKTKWDAAGISPSDIRSLEDIKKLPFITKEDLRLGFPDMTVSRAVDLADCIVMRTAGSSGEPCTIAWDRNYAIRFRALSSPWFTKHYSGRACSTAAFILVIGKDDTIPPVSLDNPHIQAENGIIRQGPISFIDTFESPERILALLHELRPEMIVGYPRIIANLAEYAVSHGIAVSPANVIVLSAEKESLREKELLTRVFSAKVVSCYASTEAGIIGATIPSDNGLLILSWNLVMELLDHDGRPVPAGETGSVVITTLLNRAMPLIRYTGLSDLAVAPCNGDECISNILMVQGRTFEGIVRPDGTRINPYQVDSVLADVEGIIQYQIIQHSLQDIEIIYVPETCPSVYHSPARPDPGQVRQQVAEIFGSDVRIRITPVASIPRTIGAFKTPLIVSHVKLADEEVT